MTIRLTVYPDECDTFGHLNQAAYLALFERARWALLAEGPGMDLFHRAGIWPAVRRTTVDYHASAWPGDVLEFDIEVLQRGRTSFTLRQHAVREKDGRLVAVAEIVFVCIDRGEKPVAVPDEILAALGATRRVSLSTGVTLTVNDRGGGGATILLLHGYPLDRTMWHEQVEALQGHRVIAPDLRGAGESDAPAGPVTLATYADDLAALLDELEVHSVVVCGLSMGGYIAFEFLRRYPDRVGGMVLMDTRATADTDATRASRDEQAAKVRAEGVAPVVASLGEKLLGPDATAVVRDALAAQMARSPVEGVIAALGAMRDRADVTAMLPSIVVPTLVVVGREDHVTPLADAEAMAAAIPGAELVVIEGAGHLPPMERPAETTAVLQAFLDRWV